MIERGLCSVICKTVPLTMGRGIKPRRVALVSLILPTTIVINESAVQISFKQKGFHTSTRAMQCNHNTSKEKGIECWKCGTHIEQQQLFCEQPECGVVQALRSEDTNLFDMFQLPKTFDLDLDQLENAYKTLQKSLHPDKFATKSSSEKQKSTVTSSTINYAYETLRSPVHRAEYMVRLRVLERCILHDPPCCMLVLLYLRCG
ncbi:Fe-S protein assembly co-chaperone HscB [archaeon]|nr:MAG: Fe-S protein assembly co-chaperone HscB [archaeon]